MMPAGDAQRAWFPEMLEDLKSYWSTDWSWKGLAAFCEAMTEKRQQIKEDRGIRPPGMHCKECGSQMVLLPISIRSALFALRKIGVIDEDNFKKHEKEWAKYRKANSLDSYGNIKS
jgi:hypothetical protein